ncbi:MAG: 2'-deoxycytidine 5'-triphosphate deaminase [Candidatus Woesebacteria bacterium]|nr:MAG: 2'-deoxycytidine 5'-triphosphate deaminase [Candidatus Woesebacteria bacterium]
MILGHSELKKLIKKINLVTNLAEREMKDPEGCVLDLRIEKVYSLKGKAFLGIDERETPNLVEKVSFDPKKKSTFIFKPGKYYLTKTIEEVNLPDNIAAVFKPRTTTFRSGLVVRTGIGNPGYHGPLYFGVINEGPVDVEIEMGARYVSVYFHEIKGNPVHSYRGQWQGGRASTKGRERQI